MPNIKVCHIFKTYLPDTVGGLEKVIEQICLQTAKSGVENTIITLSRSPKPKIIKRPEATVIRCPVSFDFASTPMSAGLIKTFWDHIKDVDLLHYHFPWPFADLLHLLNGNGKPSIITYHSDILKHNLLKRLYRPMMSYFLSSVAQIVVTSHNYLQT
nr:glycosyltransferase [Desulfobacterales bacterium]